MDTSGGLWCAGGMPAEERRTAEAWAAVTGGLEAPPRIRLTGSAGSLPSALPTHDVAMACVSAALMAAAAWQAEVTGRPVECVLRRPHVADAMRSERHFTVGGEPAGMGFAPLSTFWRAADGWVRTHANYPWHRAALLTALGVRDSGDSTTTRTKLTTAMSERPAREVEQRVFELGGVAVRVRTVEEWAGSQQGRAVAREDLIGCRVLEGAPPRIRRAHQSPAGGLRVLDLTRVIAGPVCTRYLGALGADVLRLDGPGRPDMAPGQVADTLLGKRTALLDLATRAGLARLHDLLDSADVVVSGYRPGSLDRFGLSDEDLAERHAGLVVVRLAAWGHGGPWAARRGFDSIVQSATGISIAESDGERPGALPCQLLDHGTGYLAAAAALDGARWQRREGGTQIRTLSLARTARWLLDSTPGTATTPLPGREPSLTRLKSARGEVVALAPPGELDGTALRWPSPATGYLDDPAEWPPG